MNEIYNPTIEGTMVHFVLENGQHRAALIVKDWGYGTCNLTVFADWTNDGKGGGIYWETSVRHSEDKEPHTWHFMEIPEIPAQESETVLVENE